MDKYSEDNIAKIINDCEILILPDNSTVEEALLLEKRQFMSQSRASTKSEERKDEVIIIHDLIHEPQPEEEACTEETEEDDFRKMYELSKNKTRSDVIFVEQSDLCLQSASSCQPSDERNNPNPERALLINKILKERLFTIRMKLLAIIEKIDIQYRKNNLLLDETKNSDKKESIVKTTYVKCGAPFFKNALGAPAPFNDDYLTRKNVCKEFFPFDLPQTRSRWKTKSKVALINGAKSQMISYIKSQQSQKYNKEVRKTRGRMQALRFISQNQDLNNSPMLEIYKTILTDYPDFAINWNLISFNDLESKHSVAECMGMWYSYLRPDINREPFTEDENLMIASTFAENNFNNWNDIAARLDNRSSLQTFVHFHSTYTRYCPSNVRWSAEEDARLLELVETFSTNGVINWQKIGQIVWNRNKTQCYNRYLTITRSNGTKKGVFTPKENRDILKFIEIFGEKSFVNMPEELIPGRTIVQIRSHYNVALKHKGAVNPWTKEEDRQLIEFVENGGDNKWAEIANILKTHNRLSCRTRYLTVKKYLAKNPEATLEDVPSKTKKVTAFQKANFGGSEENAADDSSSDVAAIKKKRTKGLGQMTFEKFKTMNPDLYKMMRATFNYNLGASEIVADNSKLLTLMWLFNEMDNSIFKSKRHLLTANQVLKFNEVRSYNLNQILLDEMKFVTAHTQFLMPPNYNTVIGWRALTIKMHEDPLSEEESRSVIVNPSIEYKQSLENFQKLFFSLFYWSAMLKKIDIAELNQIHFMKYPRVNMSSVNIIHQLNKRMLPITAGFRVKRSAEMPKTYKSAKKQKT